MNKKKLLMFAIPILAIALVSAGALAYYALFLVTINVTQPIEIVGDTVQSIDCNAGETCPGSEVTIFNNGETEKTITIDTGYVDGINTEFYSDLDLSQKLVDFESNVWELDEEGNTAVVRYSVTGDSFSAEVVDGAIDGYELIYYKDNSDRFSNPATAINIAEVNGNLPYDTDGNADEYNYCETEEYDTCHGAKIWYVPTDAILEGNELDWSRANEFLFETKLVQYNSDNQIIIYPGSSLTITPYFKIDNYMGGGEYSIGITIL